MTFKEWIRDNIVYEGIKAKRIKNRRHNWGNMSHTKINLNKITKPKVNNKSLFIIKVSI